MPKTIAQWMDDFDAVFERKGKFYSQLEVNKIILENKSLQLKQIKELEEAYYQTLELIRKELISNKARLKIKGVEMNGKVNNT